MDISVVAHNFLSPPILFFFLGLFAVLIKSDLEVPPAIAKFFSIYLLFHIGIKGGEELYHSGFTLQMLWVVLACIAMAVAVPIVAYKILRTKLDPYNAGAIAASYGSVSAVTFATAQAFLAYQNVHSGGYMVAGMAIMESPAVIVGLFLIRRATQTTANTPAQNNGELLHALKEALSNGSIVLLLGSVIIGFLSGNTGVGELNVFVKDIYKGMLCLYLLDMGLVAGGRVGSLAKSGLFLVSFALILPIVNAFLGIAIAYVLGLSVGDSLLFTILCGSASYIAVPAAMRMAVPQANMSLLLPMALAVTFPFNIIFGIPFYYSIIEALW